MKFLVRSTRHPSTKRTMCKYYIIFLLLAAANPQKLSSLPTSKISNPDVTRLINSTEIQSVIRPAGQKVQKRPWTQKKNPLVNKGVLFRLNPYAKTLRRQEIRTSLTLGIYKYTHECFWFCLQSGRSASRLRRRRRRSSRRPPRLLGKLSWAPFSLLKFVYVLVACDDEGGMLLCQLCFTFCHQMLCSHAE